MGDYKQRDYRAASPAVIKVIGVGGGGSNAVNRMFREPIPGVDYIAINTDAQALLRCEVPIRMQIGERLTQGLGVGGDPEKGRQAAEESRDELAEMLRGAHMVFLAAGMGGGTGTGAAPIIAECAREAGALTVAVVTKPFLFEGEKRIQTALNGLHRLKEKVDAYIVIPNERLKLWSDQKLTMGSAFRLADEVLRQGVQSIAELVTTPGEINLDFADVKAVLAAGGAAWLGIGRGKGESRAVEAARTALNCPLLETTVEGARGVLFNITGGDNLTLSEVHAAAEAIKEKMDPEATIFFGMVSDPKMEDEVRITLVAAGLAGEESGPLREEELAAYLPGDGHPQQAADLDLPPFIRRSYPPRRWRTP